MINGPGSEEAQSLFAAGIMAFLPGMAFLCYYSGFPVWLRILGLASTIPFLVIMIKIDNEVYDPVKDEWLSIIGYITLQATGILWGYFALRPHGKMIVQS